MPNDIVPRNDTIPVLQALGADGFVHNVKCDNSGNLTIAGTGTVIPSGASLVYNSGTAAAAQALTVSLPAVAAKTNYIQGFDVTFGSGSGQVTGLLTITGLATTLNYQVDQPTGASSVPQNFIMRFPSPIPASAVNTAINVVVPAMTGGGVVAINVYGLNG